MIGSFDTKGSLPAVGSTVALTHPFWEGFLAAATRIDSLFVMVIGGLLLIVTLWVKIIELLIKRRQLRDLDAE